MPRPEKGEGDLVISSRDTAAATNVGVLGLGM